MKTLGLLSDLKGKRVLLRTDFDVPVTKDLKIGEDFRIRKQKPAINDLVKKGAEVVMVSHISEADSFKDLVPQLESLLGYKINLASDLDDLRNPAGESGIITLLDNVRRYPEEKKNDAEFAKKLAGGFDIYVNNAFAVCHRDHASVSRINDFLPGYAGLVLEEETANLKKVFNSPSEGKIFVMGGAKASTKIPVIKNFLDKSEKILIGGVIANDFLKKKGLDIDGSKFDDDFDSLLEGLDLGDPRLVMPEDYNVSGGKYLDIGPKAVTLFADILSRAKMIIWNGPMGYFEDDSFSMATRAVAEAIAGSGAFKVIGGGDTIAAIDKFRIETDKFDFISTGGGAMLSFLSGERMPGLDKLGFYE